MAGKKIFIMTPFAPVLGAYLLKPDKAYKDQKHDMFKLRLDPSAEDLAAFEAEVAKLTDGHKFTVKKPKMGVSVAKADGKKTLLPSSQYKPLIVDAKNNKLEAPKVGAGSIARAYCQLLPHEEGVGLILCQVQIKKLVEWESAGSTSAFGETEGYETEGGSAFSSESSEESTEKAVDALGI